MILQALVNHYDRLVQKDVLDRPGWQAVKVSFALVLAGDGELKRVVSLKTPQQRGKKEVFVPQLLNLPAQEKRTVGIAANFLCDNSSYMLGADAKGKPERAKQCFAACAALHASLLQTVDHPAAQAILHFFKRWDPDRVAEHEALEPLWDEVVAGANLIFMIDGEYAQEIGALRAAWDTYYAEDSGGEVMQCLVTGQRGTIAKLHPSIKGITGAQSSGASLVSFNAPAFESYGRDGGQGYNAPVSDRAAFAYGAALNYLVSNKTSMQRLGDTTVVYWAEDAESAYDDAFAGMLGNGDAIEDRDLRDIMHKLANGQSAAWGDVPLNPNNRFYVLGIAPNAARLSIRFFLQDRFGALARNMEHHQKQLDIVRPTFDPRATLSIWHLLNETVNPNAREKKAAPQLEGDLMRAVLTGGRYPATLLNHVQLRIRAEREVTRGRAAIIKAYLLRNTADESYKEVLTVELNKQTQYQPYLMGRLFAVLEALQSSANPGINTTIKDHYFNAACGTPAIVFPQLIKLAQAHLKKLDPGLRVYYEKQILAITEAIHTEYPRRLSLYDQGIFQLGYYHQKEENFRKKGDTKDVNGNQEQV